MIKEITYAIDKNNCHVCTSHFKNYLGYISSNRSISGKKVNTMHRYVFIKNNGWIPSHLHVMHKCDNRACINPDHLFLGTHQDNMDDKMQKKRSGTIKIPLEQVIELRLARNSMSQKKLSLLYGICQQHISDIQNGKRRSKQ